MSSCQQFSWYFSSANRCLGWRNVMKWQPINKMWHCVWPIDWKQSWFISACFSMTLLSDSQPDTMLFARKRFQCRFFVLILQYDTLIFILLMLQPPIDPCQLLSALSPLLGPGGGMKSADEVVKLARWLLNCISRTFVSFHYFISDVFECVDLNWLESCIPLASNRLQDIQSLMSQKKWFIMRS